MKKNSRIRAKKVHVKKFTAIAAYSRKFTVKNTKKGISEVINHKRHGADMGIPNDKLITSPYTGIQYVMTNPHPIHGEKYDVTVTGYDWVPVDEYKANIGLLWEHKKHPQPKSYWNKVIDGKPVIIKSTSFHKDPVKMNRVQYMEALVHHKLAKWERKNVCPEAMFTEDVENWKTERENAMQRIRDVVVSIYDKLKVTATIQTPGGPPYKDIVIGAIKDTGDKAKTVEMANKIVKHARTVNKNILHAQLLNHKRNNYTLLAA